MVDAIMLMPFLAVGVQLALFWAVETYKPASRYDVTDLDYDPGFLLRLTIWLDYIKSMEPDPV